MTKTELIRALAEEWECSTADAKARLEGFQSVVTKTVRSGDPVTITGFAKFARVERAARQGRNPATGETIQIAAKTTVRITPLKAFKDEVMAAKTKTPKDKKSKKGKKKK